MGSSLEENLRPHLYSGRLPECYIHQSSTLTLTSVSNLAEVLRFQGKYEAAEEMSRRALAGYEKVLGVEHPSTLTSVNNLVLAL